MPPKGSMTDRVKNNYRPDWQHGCENCGAKPTLPVSGLCGPCHFGIAATSGGAWWDEQTDALDDEVLS